MHADRLATECRIAQYADAIMLRMATIANATAASANVVAALNAGAANLAARAETLARMIAR